MSILQPVVILPVLSQIKPLIVFVTDKNLICATRDVGGVTYATYNSGLSKTLKSVR